MWPERESAQPRKARFSPAASAAGENAPKLKKEVEFKHISPLAKPLPFLQTAKE
jgi:hypothetical protein